MRLEEERCGDGPLGRTLIERQSVVDRVFIDFCRLRPQIRAFQFMKPTSFVVALELDCDIDVNTRRKPISNMTTRVGQQTRGCSAFLKKLKRIGRKGLMVSRKR